MKPRVEIDYSKVTITKLPAGKAKGADDLTRWAHRRALGKSGLPTFKVKRVRCVSCGFVVKARYADSRLADLALVRLCPRCGKRRQMRPIRTKAGKDYLTEVKPT